MQEWQSKWKYIQHKLMSFMEIIKENILRLVSKPFSWLRKFLLKIGVSFAVSYLLFWIGTCSPVILYLELI